MNQLKILNYSVSLQPLTKHYSIKLKVQDIEHPVEFHQESICELEALTSLLRDEINAFYNPDLNEIIIGWEPIGENDPKYNQQRH